MLIVFNMALYYYSKDIPSKIICNKSVWCCL